MSLASESYKSIINSYEDFKNHNQFSKLKPEIQQYIKEAMEHGCILGSHINGLDIFIETKDKDGEPILFQQGLYNNPRDNTFIKIYQNGRIIEGNRCSQCQGIDIWKIEQMLDAVYVCDKCKAKLNHQDEFVWVLYASLECSECAEASWKEIDSKPSGYWTN